MTDKKDQQLLDLLAQDARRPLSSLAGELGMARTTAQARLERLERNGVIAGYTVRLGSAAKGARIAATVLVQMQPGAVARTVAQLRRMPEVKRVLTSSGRFDLILEVVAPTPAELDGILDLIGEIPEVLSSESLIHLSERHNASTL
ncbi:MAG: Lrp/AsnC family transcriptional regulator [Pseudomonadota bacterium]